MLCCSWTHTTASYIFNGCRFHWNYCFHLLSCFNYLLLSMLAVFWWALGDFCLHSVNVFTGYCFHYPAFSLKLMFSQGLLLILCPLFSLFSVVWALTIVQCLMQHLGDMLIGLLTERPNETGTLKMHTAVLHLHSVEKIVVILTSQISPSWCHTAVHRCELLFTVLHILSIYKCQISPSSCYAAVHRSQNTLWLCCTIFQCMSNFS